MINPKLLQFLRGIKKNNNKEWYENHKEEYKALKAEFRETAEQIADHIAKVDPAIKKALKQDKKKTIHLFRIYRDVRFLPRGANRYKTNISAAISADRKNPGEPVYYFHIEPGGNSFVGGGLHMPEKDILDATREYLDTNYKKFSKVLEGDDLNRRFDNGLSQDHTLKNAPREYEKDHPGVEYLRLKSFTIGKSIPDTDVKSRQFTNIIGSDLAALVEFNQFLRKAAKK